MKNISVHFSPKGRYQMSEFLTALTTLSEILPSDVKLHNAFLTKQRCQTMNLPTTVPDTFSGLFPNRVLNYAPEVGGSFLEARDNLLASVRKEDGVAIFFGDIIEGVEDEYNLCIEKGIKTLRISL